MKKTHHFIFLLFGVLSTFWSCTSQGGTDNEPTPHEPTSKSDQTALDAGASVIYIDKAENLWLVSAASGVYKYDGNDLTLFTSADGLGSYNILNVQEDSFGNLYFDTPESVYMFDGDTFTALTVTEGKNEWKSEPGDLWFRMGWDKKGPYRYDGENLYHLAFPKSEMEDKFYQKNPNASFNPYGIYSMFEDSKGNIWFGTSNMGVYFFDGQEISWMYENHHTETPAGGNFGVRSIGEDQDGNYWICNANYKYSLLPNETTGDGLKLLSYERQTGIEDIADDDLYFYAMETDLNGDLLMFAKEAGLWLNNGKELTQIFIEDGEQKLSPTAMYKDDKGIIWFGTDQQGIYQYDGNTFEQFEVK